MTGFVDPSSDLMKAVLADKGARLVRDGFERLIEEGEAGGLDADEVLAICRRVLDEGEGQGEVFPRIHDAVMKAVEAREEG